MPRIRTLRPLRRGRVTGKLVTIRDPKDAFPIFDLERQQLESSMRSLFQPLRNVRERELCYQTAEPRRGRISHKCGIVPRVVLRRYLASF